MTRSNPIAAPITSPVSSLSFKPVYFPSPLTDLPLPGFLGSSFKTRQAEQPVAMNGILVKYIAHHVPPPFPGLHPDRPLDGVHPDHAALRRKHSSPGEAEVSARELDTNGTVPEGQDIESADDHLLLGHDGHSVFGSQDAAQVERVGSGDCQ